MKGIIENVKLSFIENCPQDYDTFMVVAKFTELQDAMHEMRVDPNKLAKFAPLMKESLTDSVMTEKEADKLIRIIDRAIVLEKEDI